MVSINKRARCAHGALLCNTIHSAQHELTFLTLPFNGAICKQVEQRHQPSSQEEIHGHNNAAPATFDELTVSERKRDLGFGAGARGRDLDLAAGDRERERGLDLAAGERGRERDFLLAAAVAQDRMRRRGERLRRRGERLRRRRPWDRERLRRRPPPPRPRPSSSPT